MISVQCRVGIHCTLSNRLRSLPGLLSRSRGIRNKQAQVENSSSLSVLSVPLFSLFSFIRPPSCTGRVQSTDLADFVPGWKEEKFDIYSSPKYY